MANKETKKKEIVASPDAVAAEMASKAARAKRSKAPAHKPAMRAGVSNEAAAPAVKAAVLSTPATPAAPVVGPAVDRSEIAKLAYFFWLDRGQAEGFAEADWLRAEQTVRARRV